MMCDDDNDDIYHPQVVDLGTSVDSVATLTPGPVPDSHSPNCSVYSGNTIMQWSPDMTETRYTCIVILTAGTSVIIYFIIDFVSVMEEHWRRFQLFLDSQEPSPRYQMRLREQRRNIKTKGFLLGEIYK